MWTKALAVFLSLTTALAVFPVLAEVGEGWRYSYTYSYSFDGRSVAGYAALEVVRVLEDGRVRLRFESSFNDGTAVVEKNMPAQAFTIPRIPNRDITGTFSFTKNGVSATFTVTEAGRGERTVGGRSYQTIVYLLSGTYSGVNRTISGEARLEVLAGSGVIYSLEGVLNSHGKTATFSIQLSDANFDLNNLPAPQSSDTIQGYFMQAIPLPGQAAEFLADGLPQTHQPSKTTASGDAGTRAVVAGLVGIGALAAVAAVGVRRRRAEVPGAVKPHYV
mgnify:FL=1